MILLRVSVNRKKNKSKSTIVRGRKLVVVHFHPTDKAATITKNRNFEIFWKWIFSKAIEKVHERYKNTYKLSAKLLENNFESYWKVLMIVQCLWYCKDNQIVDRISGNLWNYRKIRHFQLEKSKRLCWLNPIFWFPDCWAD